MHCNRHSLLSFPVGLKLFLLPQPQRKLSCNNHFATCIFLPNFLQCIHCIVFLFLMLPDNVLVSLITLKISCFAPHILPLEMFPVASPSNAISSKTHQFIIKKRVMVWTQLLWQHSHMNCTWPCTFHLLVLCLLKSPPHHRHAPLFNHILFSSQVLFLDIQAGQIQFFNLALISWATALHRLTVLKLTSTSSFWSYLSRGKSNLARSNQIFKEGLTK